MEWLRNLLRPKEPQIWKYVGCVTATTRLVDSNGEESAGGYLRGDYLLEERGDGKRRYKLVGTPGHSANANYKLACVEAWVMGASLPKDIDQTTTRKTEKPKAKADLIVFPGGKP